MDRLLYKNSPLTLTESFLAIEKFLVETRLAFFDQLKLFDLLIYLLPKDENHLSCQQFLMWLVKRMDDQQERPTTSAAAPIENVETIVKNEPMPPMMIQDDISETEDDTSDFPPPIEYSPTNFPPYEQTAKKALVNLRQSFLFFFYSSFFFQIYRGKNMLKHLRPRTTLTSFARHVASDLFTREEIMSKLHVDHNNERDIFLRRKFQFFERSFFFSSSSFSTFFFSDCICTAWNLSDEDLYKIWPKIRNSLLQLRRDAIAGKCIRMTTKKRSINQTSTMDDVQCR